MVAGLGLGVQLHIEGMNVFDRWPTLDIHDVEMLYLNIGEYGVRQVFFGLNYSIIHYVLFEVGSCL